MWAHAVILCNQLYVINEGRVVAQRIHASLISPPLNSSLYLCGLYHPILTLKTRFINTEVLF